MTNFLLLYMIRMVPVQVGPFLETYNPGVDNRDISDNINERENKLDQFSSDEVSLVNVMLESRELYGKQTTEP